MAETAHKRPRWRHGVMLIALVLALSATLAPPAGAEAGAQAGATSPEVPAGEQAANAALPGRTVATSPRVKPPGFLINAGQAVRVAVLVPQVRRELARGGLEREVSVPDYLADQHHWVVTYSRGGTGVVEVVMNGRSGRVLEVWTGPQVDFLLARGSDPKMGRSLNAAWIWIPLCILFVAPFFDPKRPFRLLHLDLLVLLSFGIAQLLFNEGRLYVWVPAIYPVLAYLLVRMLLAGFHPRERVQPLIPYARESWLVAGLILLVIGRVVLNLVDSTVIDVGYTTVVGADRLVHGFEVAGYGPLMFLSYVPFEWLFPWHGLWDSVPAAHAGALTFDLLTIGGLLLLGRRLRAGREGRTLGLALAYAWVAFPYTTYVLQSNTNDGFVPMLLVFTMVALRSPARSGALLGVATAAKIFPAALAPLLAAGTGDRRLGPVARFGAAFAGVVAVSVIAFLPDGGLREMWDTTIGYQLGRESPFSLWGLHPSLQPLQLLLEVAVVGLCAVLAFVPRRRDSRQIAALAAAVVIGLQLCSNYWLFLYVSWFAPLALVAMLGAYRVYLPGPPAEPSEAAQRRPARAPRPAPRGHEPEPTPTAVATRERAASRTATVALFSTTLGLSAGLSFLMLPMFARFALPLLGSAPGVWPTAVFFFQAVALLAYLYARWSVTRFGARRQAALQLALVASAVVLLPIAIPDGPLNGDPAAWLLLTMLVSVGLPFFAVSASAPLLHSWLAASGHAGGRQLSRAAVIGSFTGLLGYPLLIEPRLTLAGQSWLWSGAFGVLMLLLVTCALVLWRSPQRRVQAPAGVRPSAAQSVRWVALGFVPSSLMLAITTWLTTELAPMPLLWVLPLAVYVSTFALGTRHRRLALQATPAVLVVIGGLAVLGDTGPLLLIGGLHLAGLFVVSLACHGELAAERAYGQLALGAALGGAFSALIAPSVFNAPTELPLAIVLMAFLLPFRSGSWRDQISGRSDLLPPVLVGGATVGLLYAVGDGGALEWVVLAVAALACLSLVDSPLRFGLALGLALAAIWSAGVADSAGIHQERDFYGVSRVESPPGAFVHVLKNGSSVRAAQLTLEPRSPTTYYDRGGPLAQLLAGLPDARVTQHAAIVGLGAGTAACLSRPANHWTFFETDPAVVRVARDMDLFTFLRDCPGTNDVQQGDGRLEIAKRPDGHYGLIVIDQFIGTAIPVHLLTREAIDLYSRKLAPDGVIAFNASSRHFDLAPVLGKVAQATGLSCRVRANGSRWVAMARRPADLGRASSWLSCPHDRGTRTWTDDYSNLTAALHLG